MRGGGERRLQTKKKGSRRGEEETDGEEREVNTQEKNKKNKRPRTRDTQTISSTEFSGWLAC